MSDSDDKIKQISRLLELGGTMLAQHCNTCGSPMFRYHGEVLCPVCQGQGVGADILPEEPVMRTGAATVPQMSSTQRPEVSPGVGHQIPTDEAPISFTSSVVRSGAVSSPSVRHVEGMGSVPDLMKMKLESLASQVQSENDPRRINEYLETIEKIIDILDRLS
ncbi:Sjogren's syndrome/scleroderma autoantigen 1 family protein [Methanococcoides sp. FTZ1]|uniref:Sjogren's syndrome/scleroderma autoantigen 1 family protein n=1 Tax=Methanococcoides sp. FTZ1 TaxID=3439061 RepID=UPI003F870A1A